MKNYKLTSLFTFLLVFVCASVTFAQYDDLYYNPDTESDYEYNDSYDDDDSYYDESNTSSDEDAEYDEEFYDYQYSSRIRRLATLTVGLVIMILFI